MRKLLLLPAFAAFALVAGGCLVFKTSLTRFDANDTFAGQLTNFTEADILGHNIDVEFLDDNGNVIDTKTVPGCLRSLQSGATDFFEVESDEPAADTDGARGRIRYDDDFEIGQTETGDIEVTELAAERESGVLTVTGTARNDDEDLEDARACIVVFDEDDNVVRVAQDDLGDMAEDATAPFSVDIAVPDDSEEVDHVDIWVDGFEDETPIAPVGDRGNEVTVISETPTPSSTSTSTAVPTATATP